RRPRRDRDRGDRLDAGPTRDLMPPAPVPGLARVAPALVAPALVALVAVVVLAGCDSTNLPSASAARGASAPGLLRNVPTHPRSNASMAALLTGRLELRGECLVVASGGVDTLPVWPDGAW